MGYTLNVDMWHWVNPETQKVVRLHRGDEVPPEVLDSEGIDLDEINASRNPIFLNQTRGDGPVREEAPSKEETSSDETTTETKTTTTTNSPAAKK